MGFIKKFFKKDKGKNKPIKENNQKDIFNEKYEDVTFKYKDANVNVRLKPISIENLAKLNEKKSSPEEVVYLIIQNCLLNKHDNKQFTLEQVKQLFEFDLATKLAVKCLESSNIPLDKFKTKNSEKTGEISSNIEQTNEKLKEINQEQKNNDKRSYDIEAVKRYHSERKKIFENSSNTTNIDDPIEIEDYDTRSNQLKEIQKWNKFLYENNLQASALLEKGEIKKAIYILEENITALADTPATYSYLIDIYRLNEDYDNELRICNQAIDLIGDPKKRENFIIRKKEVLKRINNNSITNKSELLYETIKREEKLNIPSEKKDLISKSNYNSDNISLKNLKYCLRCKAEMEDSLDICPNCHFNFRTNFYDFEDRSIFKSETFNNLTKGTLNFINIDAEQKSSSKKAKYNYNSKELFVEEIAIEYYQNLGYTAIWGENFYWETLYSLLFWDIIFMKTDTCTPYPMNHEKFEDYYNMLVNTDMLDMPNDFFNENFYLVRREAINHKLKQFKNNPDSMIKTLNSSYLNNYGKRCRGIYDWDKFRLEELKIPIECLEKEQILLIFDRMLHDFAYYRSGFPDLIVMNKEEFFFVEVKSKNDNLSERQVEWHDYLMNEVKIDVNIFSVNKTERQINNLKKKYNNIPNKDYSFKLSFDINELSLEDLRNLSGDELTEKQKDIDKYGLELIKIGRIEEAKKLFEANVKTNSPFETSYKELSMIYGREHRYDDVIEICELGMKNVKNRKGAFFEGRINTMKTNKRTYNL